MNALYITMEAASTTPELIVSQVSAVITMMIDIMTALIANPFFAFLFACGFVAIGMRLIRKAKKTARYNWV